MSMKLVSFPAMGWSKIAFKSLLQFVPGIEIVEPPEVTSDIVKLGAKHSPEFVCFPFKVTMGEFLSMAEKQGVRTFVQAVDCGPCRLGFYAPVQERIMRDLGYDVTIIPIQQHDLLNFEWLETFNRLTTVQGKLMKYVDVVRGVRTFFLKCKYIEDILKLDGLIRCRELHRGDTSKVTQKLMHLLDNENDILNLHKFDKVIKREFGQIPINRQMKPLRIMISGEIHVFLENYVNMDLIKKFGQEGVEVHLGHSLYDWIMHKLHVNFKRKDLERIAKPYIPMDIGGEAIWVMGEYIECQQKGFDGFVHVYPFTCMPEVTARGIIEGQSPDPFYMPIQFYSFDEHSGYEGMRTRLEAFIDLMKTNRDNNPKFQNKYVEPPEIAQIFDQPSNQPKLLFQDFFDSLTDWIKPSVDISKLLLSSLSETLKITPKESDHGAKLPQSGSGNTSKQISSSTK